MDSLLQEATKVKQLMEHIVSPSDGAATSAQLAEALKLLDAKVRPRLETWMQRNAGSQGNLMAYLQGMEPGLCGQGPESWAHNAKALWQVNGQAAAESLVRSAEQAGRLPSLAELNEAVAVLWGAEQSTRKSKNIELKAKAADILLPLVTWSNSLSAEDLSSLMAAFDAFLVNMLEFATEGVPEFETVPELRKLKSLWLQFILPLTMNSEMQKRRSGMLEELQRRLQFAMKQILVAKLGEMLKDDSAQKVPLAQRLEQDLICASWEAIAGGQNQLLRITAKVLYERFVEPVLTMLQSSTPGARTVPSLVGRMKADLRLLFNTEKQQQLKKHILDVTEPVQDCHNDMERRHVSGIKNVERLIVILNSTKELVNKYPDRQYVMYDACFNREVYDQFRLAGKNANVEYIPKKAGEELLQVLELPIDMEHLMPQLVTCMGTIGQVLRKGETGELELSELKLSDPPERQQEVLADLMRLQLVLLAMAELHDSADDPSPARAWFRGVAGKSANEVLTSNSHLRNPLHLLTLLTSMIRWPVRVRVPRDCILGAGQEDLAGRGSEEAAGEAQLASASKRQKVAEKGRGRSAAGPAPAAGVRLYKYLHIEPPPKARGRKRRPQDAVRVTPGAGEQAGGRLGAPDCSASPAPLSHPAAPKAARGGRKPRSKLKLLSKGALQAVEKDQQQEAPQGLGSAIQPEQKILQMQLSKVSSEEGERWLLDVVSCTQVEACSGSRPGKLAADLGTPDDTYQLCIQCWADLEEDKLLVCCDGRCCTVAVHQAHLPGQVPETAWLCSICQQRGRSILNPEDLKPQ